MKKILIVFLILAVTAGTVFAEISVKAGFSMINAIRGGADVQSSEDDLDPQISLVFAGAKTLDLGGGDLTFSVSLPFTMHFGNFRGGDLDMTDPDLLPRLGQVYSFAGGDLTAGIEYAFRLGPGALAFGLGISPKVSTSASNEGSIGIDYTSFTLGVGYNDINLGIVAMDFGLYYDYNTNGMAQPDGTGANNFSYAPFGRYIRPDVVVPDELGFNMNFAFAFGLDLYLGTAFAINNSFGIWFMEADVGYRFGKAGKAGLVFWTPGNVDERDTLIPTGLKTSLDEGFLQGFYIKPYVDLNITDMVQLGIFAMMYKLGMENIAMRLDYGLWAKFTI